MLNRHDPSGGEALAVPYRVDVVQDGVVPVAGAQEVGMQ